MDAKRLLFHLMVGTIYPSIPAGVSSVTIDTEMRPPTSSIGIASAPIINISALTVAPSATINIGGEVAQVNINALTISPSSVINIATAPGVNINALALAPSSSININSLAQISINASTLAPTSVINIAGVADAVSLLLRGEGTDGSTSIIDSSTYAHSVTAVGDAQIDTAQFKFGGASVLFDGTEDYLSIPDSPVFNFGSGDFTIECWVRPNTSVENHHIIGKYNSDPTGPFAIYRDAGVTRFYAASIGTSWNLVTGISFGTLAVATWSHIAVTRSGNTYRTFKDGILASSVTISGTLRVNAGAVTIGSNNSGTQPFNGWIDDLRITKGTALYTANFTPPGAL